MKNSVALKWIRLEEASSEASHSAILAADFTKLFEAHKSLVHSVIFQISGAHQLEDLVQEAFIRIWKGLEQFREEAKLTSWIYRVSVNVALDARRAGVRRPEVVGYDFSDLVETKTNMEESFANQQIVQQGLQALSDDHCTVLVLALLHERPLTEIADMLEVSEGTVKSRLYYAKEHFRAILQKKGVQL